MKAIGLLLVLPALARVGLGDTPAEHAQDAKIAEHLAKAVTAHSATLAESARQALMHAHEVLKETRDHELPASVDGHLEQADAALVEATKKAELDQLAQAEWLEKAVQEQGGGSISSEVDALTISADEDLTGATDAELTAELDALKQRLAAQRAAGASGKADDDLTSSELKTKITTELEEMEHQLDVLDQQEAQLADGDSSASDAEPRRKNLKARVDALQAEVEALGDPPADDDLDKLADEVDKLQADVAKEVMQEDSGLAGGSSSDLSSGSSDSIATPMSSQAGPDVDSEMPFGELSPFGREDTAQELTDSSIHESDRMVDQIEKAQVAEEKRSVYRALTRLRGAAISSFDGIARSQTGNIDEYTHSHKWRQAHPMHHLADEENDVHKWAFPTNADLAQVGTVTESKLDGDINGLKAFLEYAP